MDMIGMIKYNLNVIMSIILSIALITLIVILYITFILPFKDFRIAYNVYIVSLEKYDINTHNCVDFAIDLGNKLQDYNILFVGGYTNGYNFIITEYEKIPTRHISKPLKLDDNYNAHEWVYIVDYNLYIDPHSAKIITNIKEVR